ncbi:MAG: hypothetical protein Q9228_007190, partial [Teloschistes exilis]
TASLHHAAPVLKAAISAGFRESGVQSLKNLTDPNALPMVAIRSAGLAFESLIGRVVSSTPHPPLPQDIDSEKDDDDGGGGGEGGDRGGEQVIEALVSEEYLEMLVGIANARFEANGERMRRFEELLFGGGDDHGGTVQEEWEDGEAKRERKRAEGLRRREEVKGEKAGDGEEEVVLGDGELERFGEVREEETVDQSWALGQYLRPSNEEERSLTTRRKLAWKVHTALNDAPGNHEALSDEVLSLHQILVRLADDSPDLRKNLKSRDRAELEQVVTRCSIALSDVEAILERNTSRKGKTRIWARARFAAVDLTPLRLRIAAQVDRLHAYNNMALLRSQAHTERKIGRVIEAPRSQGSVISTDSESNCSDTEQSWSAFGRALEEEGITLHMAKEDRALLKQSLIAGSIPAKAKKHEKPNCPSSRQFECPVTNPSSCGQPQQTEEAHIDAWEELETQTREES